MRRIYESGAIRRDEGPFSPSEKDTERRIEAMRSINSTKLSRLILPNGLSRRAISIDVSTPRDEYPLDAAIPFRVTMRNSMPFPITIPTRSPLLWTWDVDGVTDASHVPLHDPPDEPDSLVFDRGERKQFTKQWQQLFRVSDSEWEPAEPGEYTIGAELNVENAVEKGLRGETTVRLDPDTEA
ncbi:hypothetical protein [Natronorubrum texcoconense]|uniref:DUF7974 domain-containing protein n=1 Tax=Natronorubrum texcoconense TaxID=1095776 RepID=A0A1G8Y1Q8_9EURY|nr:hypothetical protein [Natronorubrum texcoconense]SDJ95970.1 hypothetical protein SAMN04515672_1965 [Natronorubrum texcoconense]